MDKEALIKRLEAVTDDELNALWKETSRVGSKYLTNTILLGLVHACRGDESLAEALTAHAELIKSLPKS